MAERGIYIIQSKSHPERAYIGSSVRIFKRWTEHKRKLKKRTHHSSILQNHYNKYGKDDLIFEIIEIGEYLCKNHLLSREQGWYLHFKYREDELPYFNIRETAGSNLGAKFGSPSDEQRRKTGEFFKGNHYALGCKRTDEFKKNVGIQSKKRWETRRLTPMAQDTKDKISESNKGKPSRLKGRKRSSEANKKQSESMKGKPAWNKGKKGQVPWNKGKSGYFNKKKNK